MNITKKKLFWSILILAIVTNLSVLLDIRFLYLKTILSLGFLTFIPGLLVLMILNIKKSTFWEYLTNMVGMSISYLMVIGFLINIILPWLHITSKPLSLVPILTSLNIFLLITGYSAFKRSGFKQLSFKIPKIDRLNKIFFLAPLLFPLFGVMGATLLNNGGSNFLTKLTLIGITVFIILVSLLRKRLSENVYPYSVIFVSLSLLLMYSMRSWYISGWDINREMYVFRLAVEKGIWQYQNYVDTYNTCLSLSILPTIIKAVTGLSEGVIFKVIFQLFFVFHSLTVFLIIRRYLSAVLSFIASFLYFGGVYYNSTFTTLLRQEVAFLFFGLMLLSLFNKNYSIRVKNILFIIFGFSMIVSHYSTGYIAGGIFLFTFIVSRLYLLFINKVRKVKEKDRNKLFLSLKSILLLFVFQFLWICQYSELSKGITLTVANTYKNIQNILKEDWKIDLIKSSFQDKLNPKKYTNEELRGYVADNEYLYRNSDDYSNAQTESYIPTVIENELIESKNSFFKVLFLNLYILCKYVMILSFLLGIVIIFLDKHIFIDIEYSVSIVVSVILMSFIFLLPHISSVYNFERLFQQLLLFLSLSSVIFFKKILKKIPDLVLIGVLLLIYLDYSLNGMGLMLTTTGGLPTLNLYNKGFSYDTFYSHQEEISSINWISKNINGGMIHMDPYSQLKFFAFGDPKIHNTNKVIPTFMEKTSYVYASYSNTVKELNYLDARERFNRGVLTFNFPTEFLNSNKNLIYSNSVSAIYK